MDPLDRLFRHLTRTIRATYPEYLHRPFEVAELYQTIMPYRHHRRELELETNQDYEMVLLELLSGARGYLIVDERMRDVLNRELQAPNPDPGAFREFATSQIALSAEAVRAAENASTARVSGRNDAAAAPARASAASATPDAASAGAPRASAPASAAATMRPSAASAAEESCRYCGGALPADRRIVFCPHCGQNLTIVNCPACGTELELDWKFCTTCGRPSQGTSA